jgi:F-type H+-transporting ATPase subunit gamma
MANRRDLVKRRKAAKNIRKITSTMQLIATARFQAAFNRAVATRPYSDKLAELVADLSRAAGSIEHPLMRSNENAKRSALVVLSSNRGLCGGFNANVLRTAIKHLDACPEGQEVDIHMVGKKGASYFRFLHRAMVQETTDIDENVRFDQVEPIAQGLIEQFEKGEISSAHVVYMRFHSASRQTPEVMQLLPLAPEAAGSDQEESGGANTQYEFSPDPQALLDDLLPASVRIRLFQCFTDAVVSEQVSRMVAMKAATDAAGDMITSLTRQYNRARQTHITMELLDIIGGASAIS